MKFITTKKKVLIGGEVFSIKVVRVADLKLREKVLVTPRKSSGQENKCS